MVHVVASSHTLFAASALSLFVVGAVLDLVSGFTTAPGAGPVALTMAAGDSLSVRQAAAAKNIRLISFWNTNKVAGFGRVRSPRMHDNINGIRALATVANGLPAMPLGWSQPLYSQDTLIAENGGSGVAAAIEQMSLMIYYDAMDGSIATFMSPADVRAKGVNMMTVRTTHAFGAAGGYSGGVAINSTDDNGKFTKYYALTGYKVSAQCGAIAYRGVDTGNLRCGGPGLLAAPHVTENWFMRLSDALGIPLVPVINWANRAGVTVDGTQDDGAAAVTLQTFLVELAM